MRPADCCWSATAAAAGRRGELELAGCEPARGGAARFGRFLDRSRKRAAASWSSRRFVTAGPQPTTKSCRSPPGMRDDAHAWAAIPLIHHERLVGIVVLAAPEYRRPLDWEDFDLLRTAGRQAASSLAEAQGQEALVQRAAVRGIQPPLRLHPARHQESGQPVVACSPATPSGTPTIPNSAPT